MVSPTTVANPPQDDRIFESDILALPKAIMPLPPMLPDPDLSEASTMRRRRASFSALRVDTTNTQGRLYFPGCGKTTVRAPMTPDTAGDALSSSRTTGADQLEEDVRRASITLTRIGFVDEVVTPAPRSHSWPSADGPTSPERFSGTFLRTSVSDGEFLGDTLEGSERASTTSASGGTMTSPQRRMSAPASMKAGLLKPANRRRVSFSDEIVEGGSLTVVYPASSCLGSSLGIDLSPLEDDDRGSTASTSGAPLSGDAAAASFDQGSD